MAIVDKAQVDNVDRNLRVITGTQLVPNFLFEVLLRNGGAGADGFSSGLLANRIGVFAFDAEHVSVYDNRITAAERLGDVSRLALLQSDFRPYRNDGRLDVAN